MPHEERVDEHYDEDTSEPTTPSTDGSIAGFPATPRDELYMCVKTPCSERSENA